MNQLQNMLAMVKSMQSQGQGGLQAMGQNKVNPVGNQFGGMPHGNNQLHKAAAAGNTGLCALLLEHGVNPLALDGNGVTAAEHAFCNKHTDCLRLLVVATMQRNQANAPAMTI